MSKIQIKTIVSIPIYEINNVDANKKIMEYLVENYESRTFGEGYIKKVHHIVERSNGYLEDIDYDSSCNFEVIFEVTLITLDVGDIITGCKIVNINKEMILLTKDNYIKIIITSIDLPKKFIDIYNVNDIVNVKILNESHLVNNKYYYAIGDIYEYSVINFNLSDRLFQYGKKIRCRSDNSFDFFLPSIPNIDIDFFDIFAQSRKNKQIFFEISEILFELYYNLTDIFDNVVFNVLSDKYKPAVTNFSKKNNFKNPDIDESNIIYFIDSFSDINQISQPDIDAASLIIFKYNFDFSNISSFLSDIDLSNLPFTIDFFRPIITPLNEKSFYIILFKNRWRSKDNSQSIKLFQYALIKFYQMKLIENNIILSDIDKYKSKIANDNSRYIDRYKSLF